MPLVGDTTFGLVAEGARGQDHTCTRAKARDADSSLVFGTEAEEMRRWDGASIEAENERSMPGSSSGQPRIA